jgi:hemoglobin-like flavoprotein
MTSGGPNSRSTWAKLMSGSEQQAKRARPGESAFVHKFHRALFARRPDFRQRFPVTLGDHMDSAKPYFQAILAHLHSSEMLGLSVHRFVQIHSEFGREPEFWETLGETLVDVAASVAGGKMTPEVERDLRRVFNRHARDLVEADNRPAAPPPPISRAVSARPIIAPDGVLEIPVALCRETEGQLMQRPLVRVLYTLSTMHWTGRMTLLSGGRRFILDYIDGQMGSTQEHAQGVRDLLLNSFNWKFGQYTLDGHFKPDPAHFHGFGNPERVILRGVLANVNLEEVQARLQSVLNRYPVVTENARARLERLGEPKLLSYLCDMCTGQRTMEYLLRATWPDLGQMLRTLYYAIGTQLIMIHPQPCKGPVRVAFTNLRDREETPEHAGPGGIERRSEAAASTGAVLPRQELSGPHALPHGGSPNDTRPPGDRPRVPTPEVMSVPIAYDMLDLQEGCGARAVRQKFGQLAGQRLVALGNVFDGKPPTEDAQFKRLSAAYELAFQHEVRLESIHAYF